MLEKILVVDDDLEMGAFLAEILREEGFSVTGTADSLEASKKLKKEEFDVLITDLQMKGPKGLDLLEESKRMTPSAPVIIITAFGTIETAIQAMKMGAYDYLTKPFRTDELLLTVKKALETRRLHKEVLRLQKEVETRFHFHNLIGRSPVMQGIYDLIGRISDSSGNVLILGESGTGKELAARAIHYNGVRREGPFVAVNCAAIPENLLESELFGYKRGAFTDAKTDKRGLIFEAHEGTLFLDEITDLPYSLQAKLLRALEEKAVRPLGDTTLYPLDVRFVSASGKDLKSLIQQGLFREDLYYRLRVIDIEMPPLRNRREDIPLLVQFFLQKFNGEMKKNIAGLSEETHRILLNYSWPGNVRELENAVQRAVILARQPLLLPEDFPPALIETADGDLVEKGLREKMTLDQLAKEYIKRTIAEAGGNKSKAAAILGLDRKTLYRKIEE